MIFLWTVSSVAFGNSTEALELASKLSEQPADKILLILLLVNLIQIIMGFVKSFFAAKARKEDKTEQKIDELLLKFNVLEKEILVLKGVTQTIPSEENLTERILVQLRPQIELHVLRTLRNENF